MLSPVREPGEAQQLLSVPMSPAHEHATRCLLQVDKAATIAEIQVRSRRLGITLAGFARAAVRLNMRIDLDLPADAFDDQFPAEALTVRVREFAVLELLRARRLHEHEAQRILEIERWELVALMERAGITPTEKTFSQIQDELTQAIARHRPAAPKEPK